MNTPCAWCHPGIIGLGRIGDVAQRMAGWQPRILAYDRISHRSRRPQWAQNGLVEDLLRQSDFITLHCPLTRDTFHLINDETRLW